MFLLLWTMLLKRFVTVMLFYFTFVKIEMAKSVTSLELTYKLKNTYIFRNIWCTSLLIRLLRVTKSLTLLLHRLKNFKCTAASLCRAFLNIEFYDPQHLQVCFFAVLKKLLSTIKRTIKLNYSLMWSLMRQNETKIWLPIHIYDVWHQHSWPISLFVEMEWELVPSAQTSLCKVTNSGAYKCHGKVP